MMRLSLQIGTRQARQATTLARPAIVSALSQRSYRGMNRIEDMSAHCEIKLSPAAMFPRLTCLSLASVSASEAWHAASALESGDTSDMGLRAAFKRIDTNGNGVIEQHELKAAILASGQVEGDEATMQTVDNMIEWACTKTPNGDIDFEEYSKIMRVKLPYPPHAEKLKHWKRPPGWPVVVLPQHAAC